ncbi:LuxR C-terminal-related transcriptional regulator [Streptomyces sp. C11-1]|uniref:LuxR C-terminal-related transcriptional regulator n=1 Tax=Streptomyces durocortorensis TaxID=2811104 RepID=A0ABY9W458_9ACTN|nr:LuxR C-terminal-related transcriptional regulator [Streptomyces durocortorensis]WNF30939.1 LuxR C-terminal-related transcriptional regulator [Streptomyces durocortorensis]
MRPELRAAVQSIGLANLGVGRAVVTEQTEWVLESDAARSEAHCAWLAILALHYTGDLVSADAQCERLARDPVWAGSDRHQELLTLLRARSSLMSGDVARAAELLKALLARRAPTLPLCLTVAWLIEALVHLGEFDQAHQVLLEHGLVGRLGSHLPDRVHVLAARGALHMAAGQFRHAIDDYTACGRILATLNVVNSAVVPWRSRAALGALAVQRYDLALALAEDELIAARKWGSARGVGTALHAVAMARRDGTSPALLEEAVQLLELGHARSELMQALYDLGMMQAERKDVVGGRSRLEEVDEVAHACGNAFWARRVKPALARLNDPDGSRVLTRQENKIAQLARAGYSNRRIAETLFLAVRTVEFHLSSVYRKLDISGRQELVTALGVVAP